MLLHRVRESGTCHVPFTVHSHLVVETFVGRRADREVSSVVTFAAFSQNVGRRVPPHSLSWRES